jgi:hypothetical protein
VWVLGHIRSGRAESARTAIALGICDELDRIAGISRKLIWVYLSELAHTDMAEFGAMLPPPGEESLWMDALTPDVRDHIQTLGR